MQCVRQAVQLPRLSRTLALAPSWTSADRSPALSLRKSSTQASSSTTPRILVKPLPHASLEKGLSQFFIPSRSEPSFHCSDFTMILKPFPRHLVDGNGCLDETRLLPHWLPMPPHLSTHQGRHFRLTFGSPPVASSDASSPGDHDGEARWEPLEVSLPMLSKADDARPVLRVFVMSTKKRIHKRAVIRHRVRTKLVAALRTAIFRLQEANLDVERLLDLRKNVIMLVAQPTVYLKDVDTLSHTSTSEQTTRIATNNISPLHHLQFDPHGGKRQVAPVYTLSMIPLDDLETMNDVE
ncbi:hypothetical protein PSEUBRA_005721 [Kalmanozyma brasiliensis GHG001]|uniref:uncharacterized protein n=1 Tax=Kalmanozyma brasiliensis (strain GHG001) TaxID=1365824 RepID=UPI002867E9A9|nr:uncharacterized protein PSEUBRA_005721 [Kalmanozyma brasiliensis GHG001]KAF6767552.1 hypothetical protein PSEUBRA_005721 [Kalmanozyma brasiliensis GHG001]